MGLLDNIAGQVLGSATQGGQGNLINAVMGMLGNTGTGGLTGLVEQFASKGLGNIVNSWVGTGQNLPVTPEQVHQGLGSDVIGQLVQKTGLSQEQVTSHLSQLLPQIVDKLTPNGKIQEENIMSQGSQLLQSLFK